MKDLKKMVKTTFLVKRTDLVSLVVFMIIISARKCEEEMTDNSNSTNEIARDGLTIENPWFHFPYGGPFMGILTAFAVPVDLKGPADVFVAVNFEASYSLPENQTNFVYPPIVGSSTTRQFIYNLIEQKLKAHGFFGKPCLLRVICEAADYSTAHTGVLGDLIHVILTPSSSKNDDLLKSYRDAETSGKKKGCKKFSKECPYSLLKLVSWVGNFFNKT